MAFRRLLAAGAAVLTVSSSLPAEVNKFGIGAYGSSLDEQLPLAARLAGQGGRVLLQANLLFKQNGNASSCENECAPSAESVAAIAQAYALGLRPVVRLGQWPRTIRDFSDDAEHRQYRSLANAYRKFAAALPLPPDGTSPLDLIVLNEPNVAGEWCCSGGGRLSTNQSAPEVATCLRDILAMLRSLPRVRLSAAPTAYTGPVSYPCSGNPNGTIDPVDFSYPTDIEFMQKMMVAAPDLYSNADFFNSHPYPWSDEPFDQPLGRAGATHYRTQLSASGRPSMPVLLSEAGWKGHNETSKAQSIIAALQEAWLPDARVEGITPFLLTSDFMSGFTNIGWSWVRFYNASRATRDAQPVLTQQFNATRALRCRIGVGGAC